VPDRLILFIRAALNEISNNLPDYSLRLFLTGLTIFFPYGTSDATFKGNLISTLPWKGTVEGHLAFEIGKLTIETMHWATLFGLGCALLFLLISRNVSVLAVEGPKLRYWSNLLFTTGIVVSWGALSAQIYMTAGAQQFAHLPGSSLILLMAFAVLGAVFLISFGVAFYAFVSPNLRVVGAPWVLRKVFRVVARATG
jgi:hypothetical protein